jgi:hypothetical protein
MAGIPDREKGMTDDISVSFEGIKIANIGSRKRLKLISLATCTAAVALLIVSLPSGALADCVAHCLLVQRGMEANSLGLSIPEWSESSGVLREDLGTVEVQQKSIDSECEKVRKNCLEDPSISKQQRTERFVRLHTLGINDHLDLVPASSWTVGRANSNLVVKIDPPHCN